MAKRSSVDLRDHRRFFAAGDVDGNGSLDFDEFSVWVLAQENLQLFETQQRHRVGQCSGDGAVALRQAAHGIQMKV